MSTFIRVISKSVIKHDLQNKNIKNIFNIIFITLL